MAAQLLEEFTMNAQETAEGKARSLSAYLGKPAWLNGVSALDVAESEEAGERFAIFIFYAQGSELPQDLPKEWEGLPVELCVDLDVDAWPGIVTQ